MDTKSLREAPSVLNEVLAGQKLRNTKSVQCLEPVEYLPLQKSKRLPIPTKCKEKRSLRIKKQKKKQYNKVSTLKCCCSAFKKRVPSYVFKSGKSTNRLLLSKNQYIRLLAKPKPNFHATTICGKPIKKPQKSAFYQIPNAYVTRLSKPKREKLLNTFQKFQQVLPPGKLESIFAQLQRGNDEGHKLSSKHFDKKFQKEKRKRSKKKCKKKCCEMYAVESLAYKFSIKLTAFLTFHCNRKRNVHTIETISELMYWLLRSYDGVICCHHNICSIGVDMWEYLCASAHFIACILELVLCKYESIKIQSPYKGYDSTKDSKRDTKNKSTDTSSEDSSTDGDDVTDSYRKFQTSKEKLSSYYTEIQQEQRPGHYIEIADDHTKKAGRAVVTTLAHLEQVPTPFGKQKFAFSSGIPHERLPGHYVQITDDKSSKTPVLQNLQQLERSTIPPGKQQFSRVDPRTPEPQKPWLSVKKSNDGHVSSSTPKKGSPIDKRIKQERSSTEFSDEDKGFRTKKNPRVRQAEKYESDSKTKTDHGLRTPKQDSPRSPKQKSPDDNKQKDRISTDYISDRQGTTTPNDSSPRDRKRTSPRGQNQQELEERSSIDFSDDDLPRKRKHQNEYIDPKAQNQVDRRRQGTPKHDSPRKGKQKSPDDTIKRDLKDSSSSDTSDDYLHGEHKSGKMKDSRKLPDDTTTQDLNSPEHRSKRKPGKNSPGTKQLGPDDKQTGAQGSPRDRKQKSPDETIKQDLISSSSDSSDEDFQIKRKSGLQKDSRQPKDQKPGLNGKKTSKRREHGIPKKGSPKDRKQKLSDDTITKDRSSSDMSDDDLRDKRKSGKDSLDPKAEKLKPDGKKSGDRRENPDSPRDRNKKLPDDIMKQESSPTGRRDSDSPKQGSPRDPKQDHRKRTSSDISDYNDSPQSKDKFKKRSRQKSFEIGNLKGRTSSSPRSNLSSSPSPGQESPESPYGKRKQPSGKKQEKGSPSKKSPTSPTSETVLKALEKELSKSPTSDKGLFRKSKKDIPPEKDVIRDENGRPISEIKPDRKTKDTVEQKIKSGYPDKYVKEKSGKDLTDKLSIDEKSDGSVEKEDYKIRIKDKPKKKKRKKGKSESDESEESVSIPDDDDEFKPDVETDSKLYIGSDENSPHVLEGSTSSARSSDIEDTIQEKRRDQKRRKKKENGKNKKDKKNVEGETTLSMLDEPRKMKTDKKGKKKGDDNLESETTSDVDERQKTEKDKKGKGNKTKVEVELESETTSSEVDEPQKNKKDETDKIRVKEKDDSKETESSAEENKDAEESADDVREKEKKPPSILKPGVSKSLADNLLPDHEAIEKSDLIVKDSTSKKDGEKKDHHRLDIHDSKDSITNEETKMKEMSLKDKIDDLSEISKITESEIDTDQTDESEIEGDDIRTKKGESDRPTSTDLKLETLPSYILTEDDTDAIKNLRDLHTGIKYKPDMEPKDVAPVKQKLKENVKPEDLRKFHVGMKDKLYKEPENVPPVKQKPKEKVKPEDDYLTGQDIIKALEKQESPSKGARNNISKVTGKSPSKTAGKIPRPSSDTQSFIPSKKIDKKTTSDFMDNIVVLNVRESDSIDSDIMSSGPRKLFVFPKVKLPIYSAQDIRIDHESRIDFPKITSPAYSKKAQRQPSMDYGSNYDEEKPSSSLKKCIIPHINIMPHGTSRICWASLKAWAFWIKEVAESAKVWCQWINTIICDMQTITALMQGEVYKQNGVKRVLTCQNWRNFVQRFKSDICVWEHYNKHVQKNTKQILSYCYGLRVIQCCRLCRQENLQCSNKNADHLYKRLAVALKTTEYWRTWLHEMVLESKSLFDLIEVSCEYATDRAKCICKCNDRLPQCSVYSIRSMNENN